MEPGTVRAEYRKGIREIPKMKKAFPKIDLKELQKEKEKNFRERLEFIDKYAEWLKKTPNKEWSKQQKALID